VCGDVSIGEVKVGGACGCVEYEDGRALHGVVAEDTGEIGDIEEDIGDGVYVCSIGDRYWEYW
jgi:membrane protein implicated in regulation of membrane protease activity